MELRRVSIQDMDDPTFDPFAKDEAQWGDTPDPYPLIAEYRGKGAVQKVEFRSIFSGAEDRASANFATYSVFGYDELSEVLTNPEIYSSTIMRANLGLAFGDTIVVKDPPEHTKYRRIFQRAFMPNIIQKWNDEIVGPVVDSFFSKFEGNGKADLVQDFTIRFPFEIIYHQLGLPKEEGRIFHKLAVTEVLWDSNPRETEEAGRKLGEYFGALIDIYRDRPDDSNMVSLIANAEVDGERLPHEVVKSFFRQLMNAAGDTTYRTTGTLLMCLLNHPEQLEAVRKDRSLVPAAIEEALRWDGPILMTWRNTTRDVVLGGVEIAANSVINIVMGSGNRDETKYPNAEQFNIFRPRVHRNFGFGGGPHVCIGQHLGRLEMTRALNAVLDRLPNVRLDPDYPKPHSKGFLLRTPAHLHVRFD